MGDYDFVFPAWKRRTIRRHCKITATASYLPEKRVTNDEIIQSSGLMINRLVVEKTLGVYERRVAGEGDVDSDLLASSASRCLTKAGVGPDNLDRLIVTKFLGDNLLPMTASMVQRKINCQKTVHALDVDGGINSFLGALDLAVRYINSGDSRVLVTSGGLCNSLISRTDPRVAFLFGDGAASVLLELAEEPHFLASYFYTNHVYHDLFKTSSLKTDFEEDFFEKGDFSFFYDFYHMGNWKDAQDFYVLATAEIKKNLLAESGLSMKDIDLVLCTENNRQIWQLMLDTLGVSDAQSISLIQTTGNTMSAMLPLLLDKAYMSERIQPGMNIMLVSHGEGFSGGGMIYRV